MQVNPTTAPSCVFNETDLIPKVCSLFKLYQSGNHAQKKLVILALEASVNQDPTPLEALLQSQTLSETDQQVIQGLIDSIQRNQGVQA
mgnify:CR=1 FL=1|jgi:hypothetical protein